ncbi:hypothetical protein [Paenibacillus sp. SN-8-1]|uniref:hypothetical protein n=1 Tax=Paenibacillus sp. SN-8-1 TaxID=3435409 RepID=UPI003D9A96F8
MTKMRKRISVGIMMVLMVILLSGCQLTDSYPLKTSTVLLAGSSMEEPSSDIASMLDGSTSSMDKKVLFLVAERDLRYHWSFTKELSGSGNLAYNISYLLNLPAKLFRNIQADIGVGKYFNEQAQSESGLSSYSNSVYSVATPVTWIIMDIIYAVIGFFAALLMLIFGTIIGLLHHPINTLTDLPGLIVGVVKTVYYAVAHFFYW